jgi:hypothetical protein
MPLLIDRYIWLHISDNVFLKRNLLTLLLFYLQVIILHYTFVVFLTRLMDAWRSTIY